MAHWKQLSSLIKGQTRNGTRHEGGKFCAPMREAQNCPQNENSYSGAVNNAGHDQAPEDEIVPSKGMLTNQPIESGITDKVPQENNAMEPISNTTSGG